MSAPSPTTSPDPTLALVPESVRTRRTAVAFDARVLLRITRMAFAHPWRMALGLGCTLLAAGAQLVIPQLIGDAVDFAQGLLAAAGDDAAARAALASAATLILVTSVFRGLCTMMQNYQGEAVGQLIAYRLRLALYAKVQSLSFNYHDRVHTGDLMTRGILDVEGTKLWVSTGIQRSLLLAILVGGGAWLMMSIDVVLGCLALSFVPFVALGASLARLRLRTLWYALQEELAVLTRVMEENLDGIRVVRAFVSQAFEMARFDAISRRALAIAHRRIDVFVKSTTTMTFAFFVSMGLVLWVGGEKVLAGELTIGEFASFLAFMAILQMPVRQIAWTVNSVARTSTCGGRLFEVLDLEPEIRRARPPGLRPGRCGLRRGRCSARRDRASCVRSARSRHPPSPSTRNRSGAARPSWFAFNTVVLPSLPGRPSPPDPRPGAPCPETRGRIPPFRSPGSIPPLRGSGSPCLANAGRTRRSSA